MATYNDTFTYGEAGVAYDGSGAPSGGGGSSSGNSCDCCEPGSSSSAAPIQITACGFTFTVSRTLALTVTATLNAPDWSIGAVYPCDYCGSQTVGFTTFHVWESAVSSPSGCCQFIGVVMTVTAASVDFDVYLSDTSCPTGGSPSCPVSGSLEERGLVSSGPTYSCTGFDPDALFPASGISRKSLSADNICAPSPPAEMAAGFDWEIEGA